MEAGITVEIRGMESTMKTNMSTMIVGIVYIFVSCRNSNKKWIVCYEITVRGNIGRFNWM